MYFFILILPYFLFSFTFVYIYIYHYTHWTDLRVYLLTYLSVHNCNVSRYLKYVLLSLLDLYHNVTFLFQRLCLFTVSVIYFYVL